MSSSARFLNTLYDGAGEQCRRNQSCLNAIDMKCFQNQLRHRLLRNALWGKAFNINEKRFVPKQNGGIDERFVGICEGACRKGYSTSWHRKTLLEMSKYDSKKPIEGHPYFNPSSIRGSTLTFPNELEPRGIEICGTSKKKVKCRDHRPLFADVVCILCMCVCVCIYVYMCVLQGIGERHIGALLATIRSPNSRRIRHRIYSLSLSNQNLGPAAAILLSKCLQSATVGSQERKCVDEDKDC